MKRNSKGQFIGGRGYWKGKKFSQEYRNKLSQAHLDLGDKPPARWGKEPWNKGITTISVDKKTYVSLHYWMKITYGKADICENCGSIKRVEWANRSHQYKKLRSDWFKLCKLCHVNYDYGKTKIKLSV
jgi:hypothetical protein